MSIRLRLTLWYTTVVAVVVLVFGVAQYSLLTFTLLGSIDRQLEATASRVTEAARVRLSFFYLEKLLELPGLDVFTTPGLYIQVYDTNSGLVVSRSRTLGEAMLPVDEAMLAVTMDGRTDRRTMQLGGTRLRVFSAPITVSDEVQGIVQVGTSLVQVDQTQGQLLGILVGGGSVAILVSAGLGVLLARAALRPIDHITQAALAISRAEDLSRRLEGSGPADEVGRLAATFNEMLARLETLFRTQRRFLADVSHELRTPLTTVQGNVDLLCRGAADDLETQRETLAIIEGEVARMSRLVADLLLLARADAGIHLDTQPVELDTLLLEVYRQARIMSRGVDVRLGHEDQAVVLGDPDRLRQLLLNLVDNALKYTPPDGQVQLSLYNDDEWVRIVVSDTGIGIPHEDLQAGPSGLPLIFERFYRADPARSREEGGTGLGLSIAQWIAQAHGGQITVQSEMGEGSTFTVRLPAGA
jgi:two-component system OmpR family sensor kinase